MLLKIQIINILGKLEERKMNILLKSWVESLMSLIIRSINHIREVFIYSFYISLLNG